MAYGDTGVLVNFNETDRNPASGLTSIYNNWQTASNVGQPNNAAGVLAYITSAAAVADADCYFTVTTKPATGETVTAMARILDAGSVATVDGYIVALVVAAGTDTVRVQRVTNAVAITLGADISQEVAVGDSLGIRVYGTSIEAWYKASGGSWTQIATRTDSTYTTAGRIGATTGGATTVRIDDLGGGAYTPTLPFPPTSRRIISIISNY